MTNFVVRVGDNPDVNNNPPCSAIYRRKVEPGQTVQVRKLRDSEAVLVIIIAIMSCYAPSIHPAGCPRRSKTKDQNERKTDTTKLVLEDL